MPPTTSSATLIGTGELLWDVFPDDRRPGGAPANVAYHANQLGLRGLVCTRIGDDPLGQELLDYLQANDLTTDFVQVDPDHPTGTVEVHHAGGGPSYTIHENVAWDYLVADPAILAEAQQAAAIAFGTLAQRHPVAREAVRTLVSAAKHAVRIYDVNIRPPFLEAEWVGASLQLCHVVKFNHEEAPQLAELLDLPSPALEDVAAALRQRYAVELVCITRGKDGCLLIGDETVSRPGIPVTIADTVGAGDAFTAGLAFGLVHQLPLANIAKLANRTAALVASRAGAMPDLRADFAQLRAELDHPDA
jgi:fructokinase